ncbi:MAG TPA: biotin transporter BioY [Thermoplasmata archaeon]|nr:biotin transporter BioY [Thermoplasmata archaeon]
MSAPTVRITEGAVVARFVRARDTFYRHRFENLALDVALAVGFAALTGLLAQVTLYTPFSPVPITLQVFAALTSGVVLGYRWGTLAQAIYVSLGALVVPWFAPVAGHGAFSTGGASMGSLGGIAQLTGGLGGYILAFPVAAFLVGYLSDRYLQARSPFPQIGLMMLGVGAIYAMGAAGFWLAFRLPFPTVLAEAVLLFIPVDLAKAAVAGGIGTTLVPKVPYGPERDPDRPYRRWWPVAR